MLTYRIRFSAFFMSLCLSMIFSPFICNESAAADTNLLSLSDIAVNRNESGKLGLSLSNINAVAAGQIRLTYDSTGGFHLTGVTLTSRMSGFEPPICHINAFDPRNVDVLMIFYTLQNAAIAPGTGDILTISYQTSPDGFGESMLRITETQLSDQDIQPLPVSSHDGIIKFSQYVNSSTQPTADTSKIPEPSTFVLFGLGLLGMLAYMRKTL